MQPTFLEIKSAAKNSLKHRWTEAVAVAAILLAAGLLDTSMQSALMTVFKTDAVWSPFFPTVMPRYNLLASIIITLFSSFYSLAVMFPLAFGAARWFWLITAGSNPELLEIFYYFSSGKRFFKAVTLSFGLFLRLVIGVTVCFLPYAVCEALLSPDFYDKIGISMPVSVSGLYPLATTFEILGFLALLLFIGSHTLFFAVLFSEPELSAFRVLRKTVKLSKGQRFRFLGFVISFIGWWILGVFMVTWLFIIPYFVCATAVYGREEYRICHKNNL